MTSHVKEDETGAEKLSFGTHAQLWCTRNPWSTIIIGAVIVGLGLFIDISYDLYLSDNHPDWNLPATVLSHLFIILGEATMVTFFLHLFVEHKVQSDHLNYMNTVLQEEMDKIQENVASVMSDFSREVGKNVVAIKRSLLEVLLEERMPPGLVKLILDNGFFTTDVLRQNLIVTYKFREAQGENIVIEQTVQFDLKNIFANESFDYVMTFSISDTPLAKYRFSEASYRKYRSNGTLDQKVHKITPSDLSAPGENETDNYMLRQPIEIKKDESIQVFQSFISTYKIDGVGFIDNYYVNTHTVNARIEFELPTAYETDIYPTFPERFLSEPILQGGKKIYESIPFLVLGQGFSFSIKKVKQ